MASRAGRRSDWLDGSWIVLALGLGATGVISYLTYQLLHADLDSDELKAEDPTSDQPEGGEEEGAEADERRRTRRGGPPQHTIEWINSRKAHAKKLQKHFEENALPLPRDARNPVMVKYKLEAIEQKWNKVGHKCEDCWLVKAKACICGKLEPLVMPLDFIIYMHTKEYRRASNTGRLIPMSHPSSVVLISGNLQDEARLKEIYENDADNVVMLFPSADSVTVEELMQEREAKGLTGRLRVILPDGTWRQARSCVRRLPDSIRKVRIVAAARTRNQLRTRTREDGICSIEAAATFLEGEATMSHFVRASKYRHVFVEAPKPQETFSGLRLSSAVGEQNYIKGNAKFFAVALSGGGGPFTVFSYKNPGPVSINQPLFNGHTGNVLDFDFNPFHDNIIASASEDTSIKVWGIPEGGLTENISDPLGDLRGHERKVTLLRFNPTAANVLGSVSFDNAVKLWDIERGMELVNITSHEQLVQDIVWDYRGNYMATTSKDKVLRIIDARGGAVALSKPDAHEGTKASKAVYLGNRDYLLTVGFTRQSQRQLKIWDTRNLETEVKALEIDQAAGVIMPFFDPDTNLLYLAGKGDGNIRYYEIVDEAPFIFPISEYRSTVPSKGVAMVPKRGLDVLKCETTRLLKLTSNSVEPLSFIVPRKGDYFQEDLFPHTYAGVPSHTAEEWLAGSDKEPIMMSLDPSKNGSATAGGVTTPTARPMSMKTSAQLQRELDAALERVAELEKRLKAAGLNAS